MTVSDEVFAIFRGRGTSSYLGERVSMIEHALQAACFARHAKVSDSLVVAALLHDIGHLVEEVPDNIEEWATDARHEAIGSHWLSRRLRAEVCEPVRLHVAAKRYLCATDETYLAQLSPASVVTLKLQGGPMSAQEVAEFKQERFFEEAVRVRRWDDQGKVAGLMTPGLGDYRALIDSLALRQPGM